MLKGAPDPKADLAVKVRPAVKAGPDPKVCRALVDLKVKDAVAKVATDHVAPPANNRDQPIQFFSTKTQLPRP
jgi:hypothetical protein